MVGTASAAPVKVGLYCTPWSPGLFPLPPTQKFEFLMSHTLKEVFEDVWRFSLVRVVPYIYIYSVAPFIH